MSHIPKLLCVYNMYNVIICLDKWPLFCCNVFPLHTLLWKFLSWMAVEFCEMIFLHLLRWSCDHMVFVFFVNITLIALHMWKHSCDSEMNPTWSWYMMLFQCCWIQFVSILFRGFTSIFIRGIGLWVSFLVLSLSVFGIRLMLTS